MAAKQVGIASLLYVSMLIGFFVILTSILLGQKTHLADHPAWPAAPKPSPAATTTSA